MVKKIFNDVTKSEISHVYRLLDAGNSIRQITLKANLSKSIVKKILAGDRPINLKKLSIELTNNPYGVHASNSFVEKNYVEFQFTDSYERKKGIKALKDKGIPRKVMGTSTKPKGVMYRSILTIYFE